MPDTPDIIIARAIRDADKRYFFENYSDQAQAAIQALERGGYHIVPAVPSRTMFDAAVKAIVYGIKRPVDVVMPIWHAMLEARPSPFGK
jgi:hypothetical protein